MDDASNRADLRDLLDPVVVAAFGGWNDAGNAASAAIDHLAEAYEAELASPSTPTSSTTSRSTGRRSRWSTDGERDDHLADHGGQDRPAPRRPRPGAGPRARAELALAAVRHADRLGAALGGRAAGASAGRPAGRHPAHPAGPGVGATATRELSTQLGPARRRRTRVRPGSSACSPTACAAAGMPTVSIWAGHAALRLAPALPQGDAGAADRAGGAARPAAGSRRTAGAGAGVGARCRRAGVRRLRGRRVRRARSRSSRTRPTAEASGDAIAAEFERYLRRRQG